MLATLINYPEVFDEIEESLGMVEFSAPDLDKLRQQVLNTLAAHESLDTARLCDHLSEVGFAPMLKVLLSKNVYMHGRFARPDGDVKKALEGWVDTYQQLTAKANETEIKQVEAALGEDTSEMTFGRMKALKVT